MIYCAVFKDNFSANPTSIGDSYPEIQAKEVRGAVIFVYDIFRPFSVH